MEITPKLYVEYVTKVFSKAIPKIANLIKKHKEELPDDFEEAMIFLQKPLEKLFGEIGKDLLPKGMTYNDLNNYIIEHRAEVDNFLEENSEYAEKYLKISEELNEKIIEKIEGKKPPSVPLEELEELSLDDE